MRWAAIYLVTLVFVPLGATAVIFAAVWTVRLIDRVARGPTPRVRRP